ncbi:SipW-dependent-type signal peptide-containing protein [Halospeciosus flavus]|uniref:SipW-dependent-type signal peptide-containing protein n=1 Tax=Halospeciosus flavus TaxID=3032283 RepID=A0ABD5Z3C9_9EURY|nr:SipW-dependent-type signal peptide-containing protein [Halospeciosus flavus]
MTDDKQLYNLSRRKLLGGLGAVGLASAGAGLGTTAYFNDTESFDNNTLEAGQLDLQLEWSGQYNAAGVGGDSAADDSGLYQGHMNVEQNGDSGFFVLLDDVKPGDKGVVEICLASVDNPAYVWMKTNHHDDAENGYPEPEPTTNATGDYDDPGNASGAGELDDELQVYVSYSDGSYNDGGSFAADAGNAVSYAGSTSRGDVAMGDAETVFGTDLASGVALDSDPSTSMTDPFAATAVGSDGHATPCIAIEFELPTTVGNNVQTDSFMFDVEFTAIQARHNDGTANPYNTTSPSP